MRALYGYAEGVRLQLKQGGSTTMQLCEVANTCMELHQQVLARMSTS